MDRNRWIKLPPPIRAGKKIALDRARRAGRLGIVRVVPELVRPLPGGTRPPRLGGFNGIGLLLVPVTSSDPQGRHFAVRWLWLLFFPIIPLGRYFVTEGRTEFFGNSEVGGSTTRYVFHGATRMKIGEIVRTYAWYWLVVLPAMAIPPIGFIFVMQWINANQLGTVDMNPWWWLPFFAALLAIPLWPLFALVWLAARTEDRWDQVIPAHDVRWTARPIPESYPATESYQATESHLDRPGN